MSTCNKLDLQTLGSQPIMPQNLSEHCFKIKVEAQTLYEVKVKILVVFKQSHINRLLIREQKGGWNSPLASIHGGAISSIILKHCP
jgi:hypothetical protein